MRVFVLIFNARTENEGIHTLRVGDRNTVLLFELEDDATRFGMMLEAQDFPLPTVEAMDEEDAKESCRIADYDWRLVPGGTLEIPPEASIGATSWPSEADTAPSALDQAPPGTEDKPTMSEAEMDRIRRQLEKLL